MKTQITKIFIGFVAIICLLLKSNPIFSQVQWLSSNNFASLNAATYNETLKVISTGGSVGGGNVVSWDAYFLYQWCGIGYGCCCFGDARYATDEYWQTATHSLCL